MNMIFYYLWPVLTPVAVAGAAVFLAKTWIGSKIERGITHRYAEKLESFKAEIAKQAATVSMAHKSLQEHASAFHSRRLEALTKLWTDFLQVERNTPAMVISRIDVLTPAEWKSNIAQIKKEAPKSTETLTMVADVAENGRPYVGEAIWNYFFSYRALMVRVCWIVETGADDGEIKPWWEDKKIIVLLETLLSDDELTELSTIRFGKLHFVRFTAKKKFSTQIELGAAGGETTKQIVRDAASISDQLWKTELPETI